MDRIYTEAFRLKNLRTLVERGMFAVPELQREFVWNSRKACDLLDSIYSNYPIGTILIWKTSRRNEGQLRKQLHILPHFNPANRDIYFLIAGQQRLSVLWHFLRGQAASVTNADGKVLHFGSVYFDPEAADGEAHFVYRKRPTSDLAERIVPVVDLLSRGWRHRIGHVRPRALRHIAACRDRLLDYQAIFVCCETNELSRVRETFVRITRHEDRSGRSSVRASVEVPHAWPSPGCAGPPRARLRSRFSRDHPPDYGARARCARCR